MPFPSTPSVATAIENEIRSRLSKEDGDWYTSVDGKELEFAFSEDGHIYSTVCLSDEEIAKTQGQVEKEYVFRIRVEQV